MALPSRALGALAALAALTVLGSPAAASAASYDPFFAAPATAADFGATTRPYGVAAGDFNGDGNADMVVGRTTGNVAFVKGNGDGTFAAPAVYAWKQAFFNAWSMAAGDVNGDGELDVVWGANAAIGPVADGDVRVWYGNGDGTFQVNAHLESGVTYNVGDRLADIGTDAGSVAVGDLDGDGDRDVVAGAADSTASVVKVLRNAGGGVFLTEDLVSQAPGSASPTYFPATSTQNSPWGLAVGDADGDGRQDIFVADRALYVYLYRGDTAGGFTLQPGTIPGFETRPNVYLRHDSLRAAVGFTPSLTAGDVTGDGKADLAVGLHSGTQTPASNTVNDGSVVLHTSTATGHTLFGKLADVGTQARGLQAVDANGDGNLDLVAGEYDGKVKLLRQLPPRDADGDRISDYVDNAPQQPNAPRLDMNTDGAITYLDQLDNDGDTVLGDPEDESTWQRRGDAADADDDNDGVDDGADNCRLVANAGQADGDGDQRGDACDPLDDADTDGDTVPDGPVPGDAGFAEAKAASIKWSTGDTHFVIRIDALGRLFQNEFTGLMTDAATLSPAAWAQKCQGMYTPGTDPDPGCATLAGGKEVPVSLVVIPRLLWTDPEVVDWINDRNDDPRFELGQHGTYHASNTTLGDWKDQADRNFFSCELCGFSAEESYELLKAGQDTLLGNYGNHWLGQSGASAASPKIDWSTSANPLISYAPPFNASDDESRKALAWLGYKSFSASVHEEGGGGIGGFFSPDEQAHERIDRYGVFHASADTELEPPETTNGTYDAAAYQAYLESETNPGGLTTWLIEEVEWSGRPCNELDRLADLCNGASNRENNTVYGPRWDGWMQLLDYVKDYEGGVAMTLGEVALAKGYDNAITVANPGQADGDHDGIGDVIDGATLQAAGVSVTRNEAGTLRATLRNGGGAAIPGQEVVFAFDADGDGTREERTGTTDADGVATVSVTATRPVGPAAVDVSWDGGRGVTANGSGTVTVRDATTLTLVAGNPASGQVTDAVVVGAKLADSDGVPLPGRTVRFSVGAVSATATTGAGGVATASLTLAGPAAAAQLAAAFDGTGDHGGSSTSAPFTVLHEDTAVTVGPPVTSKGKTTRVITLREPDGAGLSGRTIQLAAEKQRNVWVSIGTVTTGTGGTVTATIPPAYRAARVQATFAGDASFLGSSAIR